MVQAAGRPMEWLMYVLTRPHLRAHRLLEDTDPTRCMYDHLKKQPTKLTVRTSNFRYRLEQKLAPPTLATYFPCSWPAIQKQISFIGPLWPDARFPNSVTTGSPPGTIPTRRIFSSAQATTSSRSHSSENNGERVLGDHAIAVTLAPRCMELRRAYVGSSDVVS